MVFSFENWIHHIERKEVTEMSAYQDGCDKGYQDAIDGERELATDTLMSILDGLVTDADEQAEWEEGYRDGYKAGEEE